VSIKSVNAPIIYTYQDLLLKTEEELLEIKKQKRKEYNEVLNRKTIIAGNILSLQMMISNEISKTVTSIKKDK